MRGSGSGPQAGRSRYPVGRRTEGVVEAGKHAVGTRTGTVTDLGPLELRERLPGRSPGTSSI